MYERTPQSTKILLDTGLPEVSFKDVFRVDSVVMFRGFQTRESVISQLVLRLVETDHLPLVHADGIIEQITSRENLASTAFGRGFAFPHLRTSHVAKFAGAIGIIPDGIPFGSGDGNQTRLVFLILSPRDSRVQHSGLLNRLVSLVGNKAATIRLTAFDTPAGFHQNLCRFDPG